MLIGLARILLLALAGLTVVYVCLLYYFRAARLDGLEDEWERQGRPGDLAFFVKSRQNDEDRRLKRWLFWGVYAIPLTVIAILVYLTNVS